jgi:hypothetical protein
VLRPEGVYLCISHGTPLMRLPYLRHESLLWHCSAAPLRATEGLTLFACTKCPPAQLQAARAARERELALQLLPSSPTAAAAAAAVLDGSGAVEFKHAVTRRAGNSWRPVNAIMRAAPPRDPRSEADRQEAVDTAAAAAATQASKQLQQQQPMLQITDNAAAAGVAVQSAEQLLQQQQELQLKTLEFDAEALLLDSAASGEDSSYSDAAATDTTAVARAQRYSSSAAF